MCYLCGDSLKTKHSSAYQSIPLGFKKQDCSVINSTIVALHPVGELTDALSAEKYITISAVKPLLNKLTTELLNKTVTDTSNEKVNLEIYYLFFDLDIPVYNTAYFLHPLVKDSGQFTLEDSR